MIQRKQSLYLLLGAVALSAIFFLDGTLSGRASELLAWYTPSLVVAASATSILAVVTIFLYENRPLQQRLVVVVQVLDLAVIMIMVVGMFLTGTLYLFGGGPDDLQRTIALFMPVVAYVFFYLARRGIQSDIELVRSMDRLR